MTKTLAVAAVILGAFLLAPGFSLAGGKIQNFKLSLCSKNGEKCVEIQSAQAHVSSIAPIFVFKKSRLTVKNTKLNQETKFENAEGYLDLANDQIVIQEKRKNGLVEKTFNLNSLVERLFVVK